MPFCWFCNEAAQICVPFQLFITVMDKLRLEIRAMDEIQPDLKELMDAMSRLSLLPAGFEGKEKVNTWYVVI